MNTDAEMQTVMWNKSLMFSRDTSLTTVRKMVLATAAAAAAADTDTDGGDGVGAVCTAISMYFI